jgi:3'(2'), 5'-bisphosphate nucleotidase
MTGKSFDHNRGGLTRLLGPLAELMAIAGGKILEIAKNDLGTRQKADQSPVTAADIASEEILREGLARLLPGVPFIAEESVARGDIPEPGSEFLLIDPLDGTREFVAGRDEFAVNVGLIADGKPILGAIYEPASHMIYAGAEGAAFRASIEPGTRFDSKSVVPIRARPRPQKLVAAVSRSYLDKASEAFLSTLQIESRLVLGSSLKFCRLAEGAADVYPRLTSISEWDVAAGHGLLEAAGGRVETTGGTLLRYGKKDKNFRLEAFVAWGANP